ncbi:MAG: DUF86 domain-containing protein [Spirochaetia bacterium]|nr:DUF86 domain-containing protein [Spirochaetia bacterium]
MNFNIENTFKEKLYECARHIEKINTAKKKLFRYMPLTVDSYVNLSDAESGFVDQLIFRFSNLQDTMGENIFPSILKLAQEDTKRKTFIDILNRLEELGIISKEEWLKLRETRNKIAHEYSFNQDEVVESIVNIYNESDRLIAVYEKVYTFCKEKLLLPGISND